MIKATTHGKRVTVEVEGPGEEVLQEFSMICLDMADNLIENCHMSLHEATEFLAMIMAQGLSKRKEG